MAKTRGLDRFSARIKNLYVELNDYAYFHSPSEIGRIDRRFTGRLRVLERLKSLFTDYETPSGAYLVTGYRGAGKSSLVAKALSEVSAGSGLLRRSSRLLRLALPILPISLLGGLFTSTWVLVGIALLSLVLLTYLLWTDPKFPDLLVGEWSSDLYLYRFLETFGRLLPWGLWRGSEQRFRKRLQEEWWPSLFRCFILGEEASPRLRFRVLAQDLFILCCIVGGSELLLWVVLPPVFGEGLVWLGFGPRLGTYLSVLLLYLVGNLIALAALVERDDSLEKLPKSSGPAQTSAGVLTHQEALLLTLGVVSFEGVASFEMFLGGFGTGWFRLVELYFVATLLVQSFIDRHRFDEPSGPEGRSGAAGRETPFDSDPDGSAGRQEEGRSVSRWLRLPVRALQPGLMVAWKIWRRCKDHLRYSSRVFIKINLSQDDIQEKDILRLIAKNIYVQYRQFNKSWHTDFHWKLIRVFLLLLVVASIYNLEMVLGLNCGIKNDLHLPCYLPSQGAFLLEDGYKDYHETVRRLVREERFGAESLRRALAEEGPSEYAVRYLEDSQSRSIEAEESPQTSNPEVAAGDSGLALTPDSGGRGPESAVLAVTPTGGGPGHPPYRHPHEDASFGRRVQQVAMGMTTYGDTFVQGLYHRLHSALPDRLQELTIGNIHDSRGRGADVQGPERSWLSLFGLRPEIAVVPPGIDYLFLLYLGGTWGLLALVLRWPGLGLMSHRAVLERLEALNDMIESRVTHEKGILPAPTGALLAVNFGKRESRTTPDLNERDIEKYLLEILSMIERIPRLTVRPEFIIIFDELDKIQHQENYTLGEQEAQQPERADEEFHGREFASIEAERQRQHKILSLVSNLKHFLTTAPAKFVFIAGREMFDASLADISDRHFFMGSVFHEVLYVPSFHSDDSDGRLPDITSLTEQYLCRFLLPRSWWKRGLELRNFSKYLETSLWPDHTWEGGKEQATREREKLLYELHNFITYLTYRSNGAPKKITRTMERFLVRLDREPIEDEPDTLCFGRSRQSLYLRISYYDQYTFGLVTYLGGPLIFSLNRAIKDYGDKILVSSSFLLDHVYKFHGEGFSWRNLELLPEIVDINRAPQLRELIANILRFLSKSDIAEIVSGLYDFKFTRRITEEIAFLSKISEEESAAFNFTLDESLAIKRHFNRKLRKLLGTYKEYPNAGDEKFVNSIAFVRMILGDLHFYDGEIDSAIIEYMEAVQALRNVDLETMRIDTLILMVRNFLKLGLAFERKKTYDSAFVTYGRISSMITRIGERSRGKEGNPWSWEHIGRDSLHEAERIFSKTAFEGIRLIYQPMFARLQVIEKSTLGGITMRDVQNVEREFRRMLSPEQARDRFLIEAEFRNKLADILFFKNGPLPSQNRVYCLSNPKKNEEPVLCGRNDGWKDLAILGRRRLPCQACSRYHQALLALCLNYLGLEKKQLGRQPWPAILEAFEGGRPMADRENSLKELAGTLSDLGNTFLSCSSESTVDYSFLLQLIQLLDVSQTRLSKLLRRALENHTPSKLEEALLCYVVAALIFRWSGSSRACGRELTKVLWVLREVLKSSVDQRPVAWVPTVPTQEKRPDTELSIRVAGMRATQRRLEHERRIHRVSKRQGESDGLKKAAAEYSKAREFCIDFLKKRLDGATPGLPTSWRPWAQERRRTLLLERLVESLRNRLLAAILRESYQSHEGTHRLEIERLKEVFERPDVPRPFIETVNLGRLSISASVIESLVVMDEIELATRSSEKVVEIDRRASPYSMFHSVFARIHSLRYRTKLHFENLRALGIWEKGDLSISRLPDLVEATGIFGDEVLDGETEGNTPAETTSERDILEFMIVDSIYCNHEIIRFLAIYGTSYMASHSMRASAHAHLSFWCDLYYNYLRDYKARFLLPNEPRNRIPAVRRLEKALRRMVGQADMVDLSPNYHAEMALTHLKAAKEAHSEGRAYSELLDKMFYLTDDFADQLEHFCAALERFQINSGTIDKSIRKLERRLSSTTIYRSDRYRDAGWSAGLEPREEAPRVPKLNA